MPLLKTSYSDENSFTYTFEDDAARTIKGFVRTYVGDEYVQNSYKLTRDTLTANEAPNEEDEAKNAILWTRNSDGSYSFYLRPVDTVYAWYVLDRDGNAIVKTKYTGENAFTYDFSDETAQTVKGFIRAYKGEEYLQGSYTISLDDLEVIPVPDVVYQKGLISWFQMEDGRYYLSLNAEGDHNQYAWYILDRDDNPIEKTKYSADNTLKYDFAANPNAAAVKGFVRYYTGDTYTQESYRVERDEIADSSLLAENTEGYEVVSTELTEKALEQFISIITDDRIDDALYEDIQKGVACGINVSLPMDWTCPEAADRSDIWTITGFKFLNETFREWCNTGNDECRDIIMAYTLDFARQNPNVPDENEMIWHDDATARRVHRMSLYYHIFFYDFTEKERIELETSLQKQAWLLMEDSFYSAHNNHGMFQNIGVLAYALLVSNDEAEKVAMISKALSRTTDYIEYIYTEDGVHKEHSPIYAVNVINGIRAIFKIIETNAPEFVERNGHYLEDNISFLIQILEPDLFFPAVGDATKEKKGFIWKSFFDDSDEALYIRAGGKEGTRPAEVSVYPYGGYAFFRSSWDDAPEEATWMMFLAATHSSTHKHGDDLSFLLYHKGELFVEAGSRNYNYLDPQTAWAYSGYAHNVLLIDGESFPVRLGANGFQNIYPEALDTRILDWDISGDPMYVRGQCERFQGVLWQRTLSYSKMEGLVTVTDDLTAEENHAGTLLFHLAVGIEVQPEDGGWLLLRDGEPVAQVAVACSGDFSLSTYTGEGTEPYYTWIFNGKTDPVYGAVLTIDFSSEAEEAAQVVTTISLL